MKENSAKIPIPIPTVHESNAHTESETTKNDYEMNSYSNDPSVMNPYLTVHNFDPTVMNPDYHESENSGMMIDSVLPPLVMKPKRENVMAIPCTNNRYSSALSYSKELYSFPMNNYQPGYVNTYMNDFLRLHPSMFQDSHYPTVLNLLFYF